MRQDAQLALSVQLPDDETFESFIGETNKTVASLLTDFIANNDKEVNSFYLFGVSGVGKSHLLHAACAKAEMLGMSSLCLAMSDIKELSVAVLEGLESIDLICVDDVHLVGGDMLWQQAIFDLFNRVKEQGKHIIITGDKTVSDLAIELPDLKSRLSWGFVEQLKLLTDDEKLSAVQHRANQRGLIVQDDVVKYLLNHYSRDMTVLNSYLDTLDKASIREQRKITIPFIKEALNN